MDNTVYLVGGGPGDIELLTRKAFRLIQEADCLIYDRLIDPQVLNFTKEGCECIYVGKANRNHTMRQEEINQLLVDKAKQYNKVVRLKGGDVYVFGRGGEEGLFLKQNKINFEVVPGISSSIAGLAYAGIPITHRKISTGFHVVTAHNMQDELADIDFEAMARSDNTCVFLMGLSKVNEIVENLIANKMDKNKPIALISNATLPNQDVVVGTLENIIDKLKVHPLPSPALIVVGDVVNLRKDLNFFEQKPLFATRILLPKVGNQSDYLTNKFQENGAYVKAVKISNIIENKDALSSVDLKNYTHIVFGSKNGIEFFMKQLRKNKIDLRSLHQVKFVCVGSKTAELLKEHGIYPDIVPTEFNSDELYNLLKDHLKATDKVLIPKVKDLNPNFSTNLSKVTNVDILELYENVPIMDTELIEEIDNDYDYIIFNCSSAVTYVLEQIKEKKDRLEKMIIISIGKKTSETLRNNGIMNYIQANEATFDGVYNAVLANRRK